MTTRRSFFATAGSAALVGATAVPDALAADGVVRRPGGSPSRATFKALEGQQLNLRLRDGTLLPLVLLSVKGPPTVNRHEQFSLMLRGQRRVGSGLYHLEHERIGSQRLRVEQTGRDEVGHRYRVDFSLLY